VVTSRLSLVRAWSLVCTISLKTLVRELTNTRLGKTRSLDDVAKTALLCSAFIIFTTIHAQDFADVEGDRTSGRRTLPIVAPKAARTSMILLLVVWSAVLSLVWGLDRATSSAMLLLGTFVGIRYLYLHSKDDDKRSYLWYNVRKTLSSP
jgi:4-hydroxybenzoate polyprenyltransferase